jgi:D-alanyl-D-alanine carboxypeptidase (penicillin-binding protein 5/6)
MSLRVDQYFALLFCALLLLMHGGLSEMAQPEPVQATQSIILLKNDHRPVLIEPAEEKEQNQSDQADLSSTQLNLATFEQVSAKTYLIVDLESTAILKSRNADIPIFPASAVKLMTVLIAREEYLLDELVPVSTTNNESKVDGMTGFLFGGKITVADLIAASLISSSNDAAILLASHHPQGYVGFIKQMNLKAQQLSLTQTTFVNPDGIDSDQQLSSSRDLSILAREVLKDYFLSELMRTQHKIISDQEKHVEYNLYNTNQLLYSYDQVVGMKTGTTLLAGQVLITLWEERARKVLIIVAGSEDRYHDTLLLADWVHNMIVWE